MSNNAKSFRDRMNPSNLENRVITKEELRKISIIINNYMSEVWKKIKFTEWEEINIEDTLLRCKETIQNGEKYILMPHTESDNNPADVIYLEECALMELFKKQNSYYKEVIVLLDDERIRIEWNNRNSKDRLDTIEISFEKIQNKDDIENEFGKY